MTDATRKQPLDKIMAGLAFLLGLATIAGAWGSQLVGGLVLLVGVAGVQWGSDRDHRVAA